MVKYTLDVINSAFYFHPSLVACAANKLQAFTIEKLEILQAFSAL